MNERSITRITLQEALRQRGETNWERLRKDRDAGIEPVPDPDEGEFDASKARLVRPRRDQAAPVRLDPDILEFFKAEGPGYRTRINAAPRSYMNSRR